MTVKRRRKTVWVWGCQCARCGHRWESTRAKAPTRCPKCKAAGFDKPARPYRRRTL